MLRLAKPPNQTIYFYTYKIYIYVKKIINLLNRILFFGFLLLGIILLFFNLGRKSAMLMVFASFLGSWALLFALRQKKVNENFWFLINIGLWLNIAGEIVFYYGGSLYYDKFLHFFMGIIITIMVYEYYSKSLIVKKDMIFFTVLGMLALWEIYEYFLQFFLNFPAMGVTIKGVFIQSPFNDTMYDLIYGLLGSLVFLLFRKEKN